MSAERVILVDENDRTLGTMEKMEAHEKGILHRAFSIFLINSKGELLIHQRAASKYHSPLLWTNTCCSHPRIDESLEEATRRRLMEEMGMSCQMNKAFSFIYKAELDKGLTEHELDHVFIGTTDDLPKPNPDEVQSYKYVDLDLLKSHMKSNPQEYTEWFKICFNQAHDALKSLP